MARDVTEARQRERQLASAKERLTSIFEEAPFGIVVCDLEGRVTEVNPAACHLTGRIRDSLRRRRARSRSGQTPPMCAGWSQTCSRAGPDGSPPRPGSSTRTGTGSTSPSRASSCTVGTGNRRSCCSTPSTSPNAVASRRSSRTSPSTTPLTGLANRRRFDQELERHLDLCERYGARGALLMMDLDHFKEVNDTLGHGAGDQLIVSVAELLRMRMRRSDLVARLGGDEFAILLPESDRTSAENVAQDIVRLVAEKASFVDGTRPRRLTASIGVVLIERAGITASQLVSTADMTMYDAKESGRNTYVILDTKDFAVPKSAAHLAWGQRIADAIAEDRLVLHAQPIYGIAEEGIVGAELLLRIRDENGALVMPGRFLYIAERLGLITPLDRLGRRRGGAAAQAGAQGQPRLPRRGQPVRALCRRPRARRPPGRADRPERHRREQAGLRADRDRRCGEHRHGPRVRGPARAGSAAGSRSTTSVPASGRSTTSSTCRSTS